MLKEQFLLLFSKEIVNSNQHGFVGENHNISEGIPEDFKEAGLVKQNKTISTVRKTMQQIFKMF